MNKKYTKSALFGSVIALILCCAMLVGTTFAWFTDSSNSAVNTIQSGTLDVDLLYAGTAESAAGKTLNFVDANGNTTILWEPGCTFDLEPIQIINKGNLALKYKLEVTGVDGDAKLLEALEWELNGAELAAFEGSLLPTATSDSIVITAHMKESAGNEYQNLTLKGIAVSLLATQDTVEVDSTDNQYDKDAAFLKTYTATDLADGITEIKTGENIEINMDENEEIANEDTITNNGNLTVNGGTISVSRDGSYTMNTFEGSSVTINDSAIEGGGGIQAAYGAEVTFNSGEVTLVTNNNTSQRYCFYAASPETVITIKDGTFTFEEIYKQRSYACAVNGATIKIEGGNFGPAPQHPRWKYPIYTADGGQVIITGGTFGFDPTEWVADGYVATQNDSTWTVAAVTNP